MNNSTPTQQTHIEKKVAIVPRKPDFGSLENLKKYWAMGNPTITVGMSLFSGVIPEGEKFFIRTVMAVKEQVKDPELLDDIKNFSRQEGIHSQKHIEFNNQLRNFNFPIDYLEKDTKRTLRFFERILSKRAALAITVFLEHLTAMGAEIEHKFPEVQSDWDPQALAFWQWHGIEEMEHKAVAFDVYQAVGGGYLVRVVTALLILMAFSLLLPFWITLHHFFFKRVPSEDKPITIKAISQRHPKLWRNLSAFILRYIAAYFKPSFHPWDVDHRQYIEQWKAENASMVP